MGTIHYSWLAPSRIGQVTFSGNVSVEEVTEAHQQIVGQFLNPGTKPVHLIMDVEQIGTFPTNVVKMHQVNSMVLTHPSFGWLFVVGSKNIMQRFLVSSVSQIFHVRVKMMPTVEESLIALKKLDPTLTI